MMFDSQNLIFDNSSIHRGQSDSQTYSDGKIMRDEDFFRGLQIVVKYA